MTSSNLTCMMCHSTASQSDLHCHEMVRRSTAPSAWGVAANYLLLCDGCHGRCHRMNTPLVIQLAHKLMEDPAHFDLRKINRISCQQRITMPDVIKYVRLCYNV